MQRPDWSLTTVKKVTVATEIVVFDHDFQPLIRFRPCLRHVAAA
jgi:hypothetical protein